MSITICIIINILLTFYGYVYLLNIKISSIFNKDRKFSLLSLVPHSKKRISFLGISLASSIVLSLAFSLIYDMSILNQIKYIMLVTLLLPIAISDYKSHVIPNQIIIIGLILRASIYIFEAFHNYKELFSTIKSDLLGALIIGGFFFICMLVFKNSIGMGDIKLFALMGIYQGLLGAFYSVFLSLVVSFFISIGLLILKKKKRKDVIPLAPSIFFGTFLSMCLTGM